MVNFSGLTTELLLKPIVIFPNIDNLINTFLKKLLNLSKEFIPHVIYRFYEENDTFAQNIIAQNILNQNINFPTKLPHTI